MAAGQESLVSDDTNDQARVRSELSTQLMAAMDMVRPILDAADGMKADLERRGWSPTQAEVVAGEWLRGAMAATWASQGGRR